ncbi:MULTISPECIES: NAD(+) diphosphatase [unclassified Aeromicrobium]|uniref:NAD(+) diphosphatase n=1 Tax=unclassified Aeromicrobium TaxID=2633570 RepID=UPI00288C0B1B|nr:MULTISPECIES: NAD(+) diphosphatase [unclassified Aeromicrobium]
MSDPAPFAFDRARHDRAGHLRAHDAWDGPDVEVLVLGGEHVATVDGPALRWLPRDEAPDGTWIFLGEQDGVRRAAVVVDRVPADLVPVSVRVLAPLLGADELSVAVHAVGMARWLAATPFCPRCGGVTQVQAAGHLRHCTQCGTNHFPRTDPAVIMLVTDDRDRALLGHQATWPEGRWSTLAGFVEPGESLEDAVRREVHEEAGVVVGEVAYGGSQPWPFPASLMLGFFAKAVTTDIEVDGVELGAAQWVTREELRAQGEAGTLLLPPSGVSISSWLIESWFGEPIPAGWF